MKTIKIIDLYNLIANEELDKLPEKIKYNERIYEYAKEIKWYLRDDMKCELSNSNKCLNDEIEIIEDENKIPEKLKIEQGSLSNDFYIKNEFGINCSLTERSKILADKINEILNYLESKGK